jgi:hypothetical protein
MTARSGNARAVICGWPESMSVVDTRSLQVVRQEEMATIGARSRVGPVRPAGNWAMALSPDGNKLILNAVRGDSTTWLNDSAQGVVILDRLSLTPVGWVGPIKAYGIVALPPSGDSTSERVLVLGSRPGPAVSASPWFYVLGGPSLTLVDSVQPGVDVWGVVPLAGGSAALFLSTSSVYRFDFVTKQLVDSTPNPVGPFGAMCAAPEGQRFYLVDRGTMSSPGSGKTWVYDGTLHLVAQFDLGASVGCTPALNDCAVSRDGRLLLVSAGHSGGGELYAYQPGRLLVLDRATGQLERIVEIGSWTQEVFAF